MENDICEHTACLIVICEHTACLIVNREHTVRLIGLEPTRREAPDPKSGVSTNSTTSAYVCRGLTVQRYEKFADRVAKNRRLLHLGVHFEGKREENGSLLH